MRNIKYPLFLKRNHFYPCFYKLVSILTRRVDLSINLQPSQLYTPLGGSFGSSFSYIRVELSQAALHLVHSVWIVEPHALRTAVKR